jgi:hypothetical protein
MSKPAVRFDRWLLLGSLLVAGVGTLAVVLSMHTVILDSAFRLSRSTLAFLGVDCGGFGCFAVVLVLSAVFLGVASVLLAVGMVHAKQWLAN